MIVVKLGDTHLGKVFQNGVPLHRRGDREKTQWADFEASLAEPCDLHIQMGDLFDKRVVPFNVIYKTAALYRAAAKANPGRTYVVNRGNHDASRDLELVSAYQLFAAIVGDHPTIKVAQDEPVLVGNHVIIPWHPTIHAEEMVELHQANIEGAEAVYGHWDIVAIGDTTNLIPAALLANLDVAQAFTGHDHLARELEIDGLPVTITGSMQPYSHAEDPDERFYVTRRLGYVLAHLDEFADKCLRVALTREETLDVPVECLQLQLARDKEGGGVEVLETLDFDAFDFNALFQEACETVGLNADLGKAAREKLDEARGPQS